MNYIRSLLIKVLILISWQSILGVKIPTNRFFLRPSTPFGGRIVGGEFVDIKNFPFQVSIQYNSKHHCGGAIIGKRYVLTAAHCGVHVNPEQLSVRVGSQTHLSGGTVVSVKEIINHPNYDDNTIDYDYSLLKLGEELVFDENIRPIELHKKNEKLVDGTNVTISGWGDTMNIFESSLGLRAANVPIISQMDCAKSYDEFAVITERMICAGFTIGGRDSCQGDSGGPMTSDGVLVGIVSWGRGCALPNYPGVYSRVSFIRDWIFNVTSI